MWLAWSDRGLRHLGWREPATELKPTPTVYSEPLLAYFSGASVDLNQIAVDPIGTEFQRKVWEALRQVPRGAVRSYAGIAADVASPRAMRAVGAANGANPIAIVIPCHRIVEAGMKLGGYSGGLDRKRRLLELEGVRIVGDAVQPGQLSFL
jgi:O-6-methylguanine DNA methyltransferase